MAKLSERISGSPATYIGRNELINAAFEINQENFGGGQPAANVYGYDMWRGDVLGTRIEQTVENTFPLNGSYTISWVGGTGTADVNGVTGLSSGDTFTLTAAGNYSVIVPTDATFIKLEQGINQTPFSTQGTSIGAELALCQRCFQYIGSFNMQGASVPTFAISQSAILAVPMRNTPIATFTAELGSGHQVLPYSGGVSAQFKGVGDGQGRVNFLDITLDARIYS
jgi:hypothetical protein